MIHRCFNCEEEIDTEEASLCKLCYWFECSVCHSCGCDYYEDRESKDEYRERKGRYGRDYIYDEDGEIRFP